jgi:hypothetical protein
LLNGETCPQCNYSLLTNGFCSNERCKNAPSADTGLITLNELDELYPELPLFHGRRWGSWKLSTKSLALKHEFYEIDLETIGSSGSMLDWIFQVQQKTWADASVMNDLLAALHDIFDPQANLCSFCEGESTGKTFNPTQFLRKRVKRPAA